MGSENSLFHKINNNNWDRALSKDNIIFVTYEDVLNTVFSRHNGREILIHIFIPLQSQRDLHTDLKLWYESYLSNSVSRHSSITKHYIFAKFQYVFSMKCHKDKANIFIHNLDFKCGEYFKNWFAINDYYSNKAHVFFINSMLFSQLTCDSHSLIHCCIVHYFMYLLCIVLNFIWCMHNSNFKAYRRQWTQMRTLLHALSHYFSSGQNRCTVF